MIHDLIARLREPSTYAGLAGIALAIGLTEPQWAFYSAVAAGAAGVIAMIIGEK